MAEVARAVKGIVVLRQFMEPMRARHSIAMSRCTKLRRRTSRHGRPRADANPGTPIAERSQALRVRRRSQHQLLVGRQISPPLLRHHRDRRVRDPERRQQSVDDAGAVHERDH